MEDKIEDIIADERDVELKILKIIMFPKKEKSKSGSGLIEFDNPGQAMDCLALFNHISIESNQSEYPYNVKFCFATQDLSQTDQYHGGKFE